MSERRDGSRHPVSRRLVELPLGGDAVLYVFDESRDSLNALFRSSRSLLEHGRRHAFDTRHR